MQMCRSPFPCIDHLIFPVVIVIISSVIGPGWKKIYAHDIAGGVFANLDEAKKKNVQNETAALFSILYDLESMRDSNGMFHFKLCYPERTEHDFPCNEWKQRSNPVVESTIQGFVGIHLTWPLRSDGGSFEGLLKSNPTYNLMDDDPGNRWFNSVGTISYYKGQIPGPVLAGSNGITVNKKEMYVYAAGKPM